MQAASYLRLSIVIDHVIDHVIGLGDGSVRLIPVCYSACVRIKSITQAQFSSAE